MPSVQPLSQNKQSPPPMQEWVDPERTQVKFLKVFWRSNYHCEKKENKFFSPGKFGAFFNSALWTFV